MTAREIIKKLKEDGWQEILPRTSGSHRQFKHPVKEGRTTVADHGSKDILLGTLKRIEQQCGLKLR